MATINSMVPHQLETSDIPSLVQNKDTPTGNINLNFYTGFLCDEEKVWTTTSVYHIKSTRILWKWTDIFVMWWQKS